MEQNTSIFKYNTDRSPNLFIIAGPCVIESREICLKIASTLTKLSSTYKIDIIFKASYDKANRTSRDSFRGPGRVDGLNTLSLIKKESELPVLTDIHESSQVKEVADVVDVIQIPAFLCRQTDLLVSAGESGKIVNIKKGQFMSPEDMRYSLAKAGNNTWITERGTFFGYNRLVVDFGGFPVLKSLGKPVVFDATHSVQMPGGGQGCSSGNRELALPLAKAALTMGANALFFEVHPEPEKALCDGPNSLRLSDFEKYLPKLIDLYKFVRDQD
jgi:2-dehydro-3-deoxyphosphooctonate aldolase (KDO 8-P synthase)